MEAIGLTAALFAFWFAIGYAIQLLLYTRSAPVQSLLLAPCVGVASTVLSVFALNRAGLSVAFFGRTLAGVLLILGLAVFWRVKPVVPVRATAPFVGILAVALLITGRPMFEFGFNWLSYVNDDMANYVLGAGRFLHQGYFDVPPEDALVQGRDYSLVYWFLYVFFGVRPGSELLLAWVTSVTGLTGYQSFMPLILALNLVLISATGALVYRGRAAATAAGTTCALLSLSSLNSLGVLYQLLGQVAGLALFAGCLTVLCSFDALAERWPVRRGVLTGLLAAALLVVYPEVYPFLAVAWLLYMVVGVASRQVRVRAQAIALMVAVAAVLLLVNSYALSAAEFFLIQTRGLTAGSIDDLLFPYYLVPSGLADLWGFQSIDRVSAEPFLTVSIAAGAVLLMGVTAASAWLTRRREPVAIVTLVMLLLAVRLFSQRSDFGLFKLAMFVQPFMLGTLAVAWLAYTRGSILRFGPLLAIGLLGLHGHGIYVERSRGIGGVGDVPGASSSHLGSEFEALVAANPAQHIVLDTPSVVLAKIQASYLRGFDARFDSNDFFGGLLYISPELRLLPQNLLDTGRSIRSALNGRFVSADFQVVGADDPNNAINHFLVNQIDRSQNADTCDVFIQTTGSQSIFNRRNGNSALLTSDFVIQPCSSVRNHLIFVQSSLGQHYYFGREPNIAVYQLERDPLFADGTFSAIGQHLLFLAVNPSVGPRLMLDVTESYRGDGENRLPPAAAIGTAREPLPLLGRGSARVFSAPLTPQGIDGAAYLALDMGVAGRRPPQERTGLMTLFGSEIPVDRRQIVAFARGIALIADDEYRQLPAPPNVKSFPADLFNPALEYSGVYEDGWVSESAYFIFDQSTATGGLSVRGMVPLIDDPNFSTILQVLIDGQPVAKQTLRLGDFALDTTSFAPPGKHRVELQFSATQRLPGGDGRPAAAHLERVGFGF